MFCPSGSSDRAVLQGTREREEGEGGEGGGVGERQYKPTEGQTKVFSGSSVQTLHQTLDVQTVIDTSEHTEQENDTPEQLLGWTVSYLIRRMWLSGFQLLLATRTELKILRVCRKDNHTHTHS